MRNIIITKKLIKATNAFYERPAKEEYKEEEELEAKFCLECCDTKKHKTCNGTCEEFRQFKKTLVAAKKRAKSNDE